MQNETQLPAIPAEAKTDLGEIYRSMIELAKDPAVDPAKMETLLAMQERMMDRESLRQYRAAMHAVRQEMPRIEKDGSITNKAGEVQSRYAHYEAIDKIVRPLAAAHGLTYGFDYKEGDNGRVLVTCIVSHVGGHEERFGPMPLAIDTTGAKNATQGAGSAGSYGMRYTLCAAFNIVTTGADDDGAGAGRARTSAAMSAAGDVDRLLDDAQRAAAGGRASYEAFFGGLTNMQRGWLLDQGHHANLKKAVESMG